MEPRALDMLGLSLDKHSTTRVYPSLVSFYYSPWPERVSHHDFSLHSLMTKDIEHCLSFGCWILMCSFEKVYIHIFYRAFNWIVCIAEF